MILLSAALALGMSANMSPMGDCIKGSGQVVKKQLTVEAFHGIMLEGSIDVVLTPGAAQAVEVEGQENLVDLVTAEVSNGVWRIDTKDGYSTNKPFVVHITVPMIDQVSIEGSGDVSTTGQFKADRMQLTLSGTGDLTMDVSAHNVQASIDGSGDITLSGTCDALTAAIAGSGDITANKLRSSNAEASIEGSGDVFVHASQSLTASIAGSGNITYMGHPVSVSKNVDGSGEVVSSDDRAR